MILLDTDVLIDHLRGVSAARRFLKRHPGNLAISVVTVAELYAGVRPGAEEAELEAITNLCRIYEIDRGIAQQAGRLRKQYFPSSGIDLSDALIAATAQVHRSRLATLNRRHYPMLRDLIVPYRR